eukprot:2039424-Pleurochrysis_carterae.AAC.1
MRASAVAAFHVAARPLALRGIAFLAWSVSREVAAFAVLTRLRRRRRIQFRAQLFGDEGTALWFVELDTVTTHFPRFEVA